MCGDGPSVHGADVGKISTNAARPRDRAILVAMEPEAAQGSDATFARCLERQIVPAPFEGDVKALQLIINVDKEAKNPDSEDGLRAIESIAKNFIFHARNSSLFLSQINDRNYVEF